MNKWRKRADCASAALLRVLVLALVGAALLVALHEWQKGPQVQVRYRSFEHGDR